MLRARNTLGRVLIITGMMLLAAGLAWWAFAVKALVKFPSGYRADVGVTGEVTRYSSPLGLETLPEPKTFPVEASLLLNSLDEEYTSREAVVVEAVSVDAPGAGEIGIGLEEENVYVFDRRDCRNVDGGEATSGGSPADRSGTVYPNFPIGTEKRSYELFDNDAGSSFTVTFTGEETRNGVRVFIFKGSFSERPMLAHRAEERGLHSTTTFGAMKAELAAGGVPVDEMIRAAYRRLTPEEIDTINSFTDDLPIALEYFVSREWEGAVQPVSGTVVDVIRDDLEVRVGAEKRTFLPLLQVLAARAQDPAVSRYLSQVDQQEVLEPGLLYSVSMRWAESSVEERSAYAGGRIGPIRLVRNYALYTMILLGAGLLISGLLIRGEPHHVVSVIGDMLTHRHEEGEERGEAGPSDGGRNKDGRGPG